MNEDQERIVGMDPKATGLDGLVIWLSREQRGRAPFIEVTQAPGSPDEDPKFDPEACALITLEPDVMLVRDTLDLQPSEFKKIETWVNANFAAIDAYWSGTVPPHEYRKLGQMAKKLPAGRASAWGA